MKHEYLTFLALKECGLLQNKVLREREVNVIHNYINNQLSVYENKEYCSIDELKHILFIEFGYEREIKNEPVVNIFYYD